MAARGRADTGLRMLRQPLFLVLLTSTWSQKCVFEMYTAWQRGSAGASWQPAACAKSHRGLLPPTPKKTFLSSMQKLLPMSETRVSTSSTHVWRYFATTQQFKCNTHKFEHLQSYLWYRLRSVTHIQIHPCNSWCSNRHLCLCVSTWNWSWTSCHP